MPIPRKYVPVKDLMKEEKAAQILLNACAKAYGLETYPKQYEGELYCSEKTLEKEFSFSDDITRSLYEQLDRLDQNQPFLKFGEEGIHYGFELFLSDPIDGWGSRGNQTFWMQCARKFSDEILPMTEDEIRQKYQAIVNSYGFRFDERGNCFSEELNYGGMSGGEITKLGLEGFLGNLIHRNKKYHRLKPDKAVKFGIVNGVFNGKRQKTDLGKMTPVAYDLTSKHTIEYELEDGSIALVDYSDDEGRISGRVALYWTIEVYYKFNAYCDFVHDLSRIPQGDLEKAQQVIDMAENGEIRISAIGIEH